MLVFNNDGDIFEERRKKERRAKSKATKGIDAAVDRRKDERRKKNINSPKKMK